MNSRYRDTDFTHPSEGEALFLSIPPTCGHACGQAGHVLPGGKAIQGGIRGHPWEEGGTVP